MVDLINSPVWDIAKFSKIFCQGGLCKDSGIMSPAWPSEIMQTFVISDTKKKDKTDISSSEEEV